MTRSLVASTLTMNPKGALELGGVELITGMLLEVELDGHWRSVKVDTVQRPGLYTGVLEDGQTIELAPGMRAVMEPESKAH